MRSRQCSTALAMFLLLYGVSSLPAQDRACTWIRGRAHLYTGDGQLRVWHVSTKHEFQPDASTWPRVNGWLEQGIRPQEERSLDTPVGLVYLSGDFLVCPTEPFREGAVQTARILQVKRKHYTYDK